ncbi:hypothetical protein ARALYDRAFT_358053 [Arabidopsis lyrata subsp. lyrata]|uniref:Uncharacterized protein n=1 Tax=Arabidopsis lyrata subsp. lyrata TaxID=81972 RepID=D7MPN8_ARALL|nr:hypothetical protein ARALYDRAFT_358053 [Arabidopsis lyrata subsp. lyrata]
MGKRLKKCSASTDAESTTEPSQNEETDIYGFLNEILIFFLCCVKVLDDLEVTLKKQKKEIDEDEKTALKKDEEKALALDGSYLGSLRLEVRMAKRTVEYVAYPNFKGCKRCHGILSNRRYVNYVRTCRGHIHPWSPESILLRDELRRKVESKNAHEKVEAENQS